MPSIEASTLSEPETEYVKLPLSISLPLRGTVIEPSSANSTASNSDRTGASLTGLTDTENSPATAASPSEAKT